MKHFPKIYTATLGLLAFAASFSGTACMGEDEPPVVRVERIVEPNKADNAGQQGVGATITINFAERPLKQLLDYLTSVSNLNIRALKKKDEELLVSVHLENVGYRAVLDFIAKKYGLIVDDSQLPQRIITLTAPEKVHMAFTNADIRDVINAIALQANANIVVGPEVQGTITMRLENVPWNEALQIVVKTLDFRAVQDEGNTIRIVSPQKLTRLLETRIFRLAYLTPEGAKYVATINTEFAKREDSKDAQAAGVTLLDMLTKLKTDVGQISFVKRASAIVVKDTQDTLDAMQQVIAKLDIAPKQIHVAVKMVEINDQDSESLGVNWSQGIRFAVNPVSNWTSTFPFDVHSGLTRSLLGSLAAGPGAGLHGRGDIVSLRNGGTTTYSASNVQLGSMGFDTTTALLQLIKTKTTSKLLIAPQLVTLDNEDATIQVGQLFRYAESFVANTEGGGNVSGFREAANSPIKLGVQLLLIPHVTGPENNIQMTIVPKTETLSAGSPKTIRGPSGEELILPDTDNRIVVTKMLLRNGETGVIGGLRSQSDTRQENKIPGLGDIPFIGRLFKWRTHSTGAAPGLASNLMIFVTPTIVDLEQHNDFSQQLEALRQKMTQPLTTLGEEEASSAK